MTVALEDWNGHAESRRMDALFRAEQDEQRDPQAYVRFWNKFMVEEGVERSYEQLQHSKKKNATGALAMTLPRDTLFYDHLFNNPDGEDAMIPITSDTPGDRWSGKVDRCAVLRDENGVETIEVSALHDWNHVATTCLWSSPYAPLLAQLPRHDIKFGGAASVVTQYLASNLSRLQLGYWTAPVNWAGKPKEWVDFGSALFPIAVVPVNPFTDTSRFVGGSARFDMASPFIDQFLKDAGLVLEAEMFLPDEDEQPAPEWFYLDRPTIVLRVRDESAVTGPTGTLLDGIISFFEDFLDDGVTPVRYPNFGSEMDYEDVYVTGALGTKKAYPWIWYFDGEYSGIGQSEIAIHKPLATDILVGGRSPSYVNAAIEIGIKNMLAWLGLLVGIPGLDSLYRGQLDDVFFAFNMTRNSGRVQRAGPYAWREHFVTGSEKAFTLDGVMASQQGQFDTRGYTSHKATIEDNAPYTYGRHMQVGSQIGFVVGDLIFTDYISEATYTDTRTSAASWQLTVGNGSDEEDSVTKGWNRKGQLAQVVATLSKDVGMEADWFGLF